ncbi:FG-GAP-like repeat-containing protein [Streptomyces sp. NPDC048281]|uniref:FG-GAP-like repeat-containing protein n=1 Tax=Streptomyces sp. NPDC048281 TaxID=3154715 RepID=UPI003445F0C5
MRKRTLLLATALTTGLLSALPATTASATPSGLAGDFNGDGYRDVAVAAPLLTVGKARSAGAVVVFYGSATGVSAAKRVVITQNTAGVPGTAATDDRFGDSLATGDLDGDGYADLAVGARFESVGSQRHVGQVTVLWGGRSGLTSGTTLPVPAGLREWGGYGAGLAVGDFNGDGRNDLTATGQTDSRVYQGPFTRKGAATTFSPNIGTTYDAVAGDLNGDGAAERLHTFEVSGDEGGEVLYFTWNGAHYVRKELPGADGIAAAIADVNGDGYGDIVLGDAQDPRSGKPSGHKGGQISVWYGSATGPDPDQTPTVIDQDTAGVPDTGEAGDAFGASLSAGDVNGDGYADVAVGAPGENVGTKADAGAVTVLYGSATGLAGKGAKTFTQNTAGVPGTAETADGFGGSVRLIDLDKNRRADLVVGVHGEDAQFGAVTVLKGATTGLTGSGARTITAANVGLKSEGFFGAAIGQ